MNKKYLMIVIIISLVLTFQLYAIDDISLSGTSVYSDYKSFIKELGSTIRFQQLHPAIRLGLTGFDIDLSMNSVNINDNKNYWKNSFEGSGSDNIMTPRLVVRKGLPFGLDVEAMYMPIIGTNITSVGAGLKYSIIKGSTVKPAVSVRAAYSTLIEKSNFKLYDISGVLSISKGFGPIVPFGILSFNNTKLSPDSNLPLDSESTSNISYGGGVQIDLGLIGFKFSLVLDKILTYNFSMNVGLD